MQRELDIDHADVDLIVDQLKILTNDTHYREEIQGNLENPTASRSSKVVASKALLKRLKHSRDLLQSYVNRFDTHIEALHEEYLPDIYHEGLSSLSVELLYEIFDYALDADPEIQISVSQTCRRLRYLALRRSRLWSTIHSRQTSQKVSLWLERTKEEALQITIDGHSDNNPDWGLLYLVHPHTDKFQTLEIRMRRQMIQSVDPLCQDMTSHSLTSLTLVYPFPLELANDDPNDPIDHRNMHFYTSWSFPNLKILSVENIIPKMTCGGDLTAVKISLGNLDAHYWNFRSLVTFLSSISNLKELSLSLSNAYTTTIAIPATSLTKLEYLTVRIGRGNSVLGIRKLMEALHMPLLTSMDVDLNLSTNDDESEWIRRIFPASTSYRFLKKLSIRLYTPFHRGQATDGIPFERFPSLHHLSVEAPDARNSIWNLSTNTVPPLRTLRLKNCSRRACHFIGSMLRRLKKGSAWDEFQALEVIACPHLKPEILEMYLPKEKIVYKNS